MDLPVDQAFTKALPKCELHAHLSGSISRTTLHEIWQKKKTSTPNITLGDPAIALKPAGTFPTILSFFQIFNDYIYNLINDRESIAYATRAVIEDFRQDGVRYLELRTTPREIPSAGITREEYVRIVLEALEEYYQAQLNDDTLNEEDQIEVHLILSIDRTMTASQADDILDLAEKYQQGSAQKPTPPQPTPRTTTPPITSPQILGLDLCGNPTKGDISIFTPTFLRATQTPLKTTLHFAEIPHPNTPSELPTLLSWSPARLGHAINIPAPLKQQIRKNRIALELCLSCNVLAGMTQGGFRGHHFGEWFSGDSSSSSGCAVALGTDDVGVFESALSNEYFLAADAFGLGRGEVVGLAKGAVGAAFGGKGRGRMERLIAGFERRVGGGGRGVAG
jgi:adenosine deaminase